MARTSPARLVVMIGVTAALPTFLLGCSVECWRSDTDCGRRIAAFGAAMAESSRSQERPEVSCRTTCYPLGGGVLDCRSVCR